MTRKPAEERIARFDELDRAIAEGRDGAKRLRAAHKSLVEQRRLEMLRRAKDRPASER